MAEDYAAYALSQRAAFEQTFPVVMDAAREFDGEDVLRVMDLGAADGVNSHALMADLIALRGGRSLVYSFVDMPTNAWTLAKGHLERDARLGSARRWRWCRRRRPSGRAISAREPTSRRRMPTPPRS